MKDQVATMTIDETFRLMKVKIKGREKNISLIAMGTEELSQSVEQFMKEMEKRKVKTPNRDDVIKAFREDKQLIGKWVTEYNWNNNIRYMITRGLDIKGLVASLS